jgi:F-type H+-transporting ATPase subunit delta
MRGGAIRKYAKALFEIAKEENLTEEIYRGVKELEENLDREVIEFFALPTVQLEEKANLLKDLKERLNLHPYIINTILLLLEKNKARGIPLLLSHFTQLFMEAKGYVIAEVKTARRLSEAEEKILIEKIEEWTGKEVFLRREVDESLIGGIIIKIGDFLIDNSVFKKLKNLAEHFKGERA